MRNNNIKSKLNWPLIIDWILLSAALLTICSSIFTAFSIIKEHNSVYILTIGIVMCLCIFILLLLLLKFRYMYHKTVTGIVELLHLSSHGKNGTYYELQRLWHKQLINIEPGTSIKTDSCNIIIINTIAKILTNLKIVLKEITAADWHITITQFDTKNRLPDVPYEDLINNDDLYIRILYQTEDTPEGLIREVGGEFSDVLFKNQKDLCYIIKERLNWLFIPDMRAFCIKHSPDTPLISDTKLLEFTECKLIVPIRCLQTMPDDSQQKFHEKKHSKQFRHDFIGFLSVYTDHKNAMRPHDELLYMHLVSSIADCIYPLLERYRTYVRYADSFHYFKDAHEKILISDVFGHKFKPTITQ
jgi:hypothetical protein